MKPLELGERIGTVTAAITRFTHEHLCKKGRFSASYRWHTGKWRERESISKL